MSLRSGAAGRVRRSPGRDALATDRGEVLHPPAFLGADETLAIIASAQESDDVDPIPLLVRRAHGHTLVPVPW